MFLSGGIFTKAPDTVLWSGSVSSPLALDLAGRWFSYSALYKGHPFIRAVVDKLGGAAARLPRKVYERAAAGGRTDASDSPYGQLLRRPNNHHHPYLVWLWTQSTIELYGEAFWGKVRDAGGRPVELIPMHPTNVHDDLDDAGRVTWAWDNGRKRVENIARRDLVHFRLYNPDTLSRGLSRMESLRATLANDDGALRANSALWANGGRPSVYLRHPNTLSDGASKRIAAQWADLHGGVDNWAKAAVLEEGMEAQTVTLNAEELQYIEARKFNREEICGVFDVPPPVVHILDNATFSNITEQMRSMYRDTMAPRIKLLEETLAFELRDGRFDQDVEPDFSENVYMEFLMDEVLRGDFEVRTASMAQAIQTGQMTMAEARKLENRPFVEGSDQLLVNGALVPLAAAGEAPDMLPAEVVRSLMGRLSRQENLSDVNPGALVEGLNGHGATVLRALESARHQGDTVPQFRSRLAALGG